jgi:hypothetical protein
VTNLGRNSAVYSTPLAGTLRLFSQLQGLDFHVPSSHNYFMCSKSRSRSRLRFLLPVILLFLLTFQSIGEASLKVPREYGELIYQCNEKSICQVYIIGMSHRDTITVQNDTNTSKVQAEVYKLGEWLVRDQNLELLLPEGFFKSGRAKANPGKLPAAGQEKKPETWDIKRVEERLSNNQTYVNAEMLLKENYQMKTEQVEDLGLYDAVRSGISKIFASGGSSVDYFIQKAGLDYLQERRTAAMLQNIPTAIGDAFGRGAIREKKAIFTIGMSHVLSIIKYLNEKKIKIFSPRAGPSHTVEDYIADLNLSKGEFGVSIIIPRSLADDPRALRLNHLERAVSDFRTQGGSRLQ